MRKQDAGDFSEFITNEARRYDRDITASEIELWFDEFRKTTIEDFKAAWIAHKRNERNGNQFPKIQWILRILKADGDPSAARDWRCAETIDGKRCQYPGAISFGVQGGGPWFCMSHFRMKGSEDFSPQASVQIIEASERYKAPTTIGELYAIADARRLAARNQRTRAEAEASKRDAPPSVTKESGQELIGALHSDRIAKGLDARLGIPVAQFSPADDSHLFEEEAGAAR